MIDEITLRDSRPADRSALEELYPQAFPHEDLLPLLHDLLGADNEVLSLVAIHDDAVVGHVAFTPCAIAGSPAKVALLGPVAVDPRFQKQGIGTALIEEGFTRLRCEAIGQVHVLGDPAYYRRFGFEPDASVTPPYPLPAEWNTAWQSVFLHAGIPASKGALLVPAPWRHPALWGA